MSYCYVNNIISSCSGYFHYIFLHWKCFTDLLLSLHSTSSTRTFHHMKRGSGDKKERCHFHQSYGITFASSFTLIFTLAIKYDFGKSRHTYTCVHYLKPEKCICTHHTTCYSTTFMETNCLWLSFSTHKNLRETGR